MVVSTPRPQFVLISKPLVGSTTCYHTRVTSGVYAVGSRFTLEVFPYFRSRARSMAIFNFKGECSKYLPSRTRKTGLSALCTYGVHAHDAVICKPFITLIVTPQSSVSVGVWGH